MESGRTKFGNSSDGVTWSDTTAEEIAYAKSKIAELTTFLQECGDQRQRDQKRQAEVIGAAHWVGDMSSFGCYHPPRRFPWVSFNFPMSFNV